MPNFIDKQAAMHTPVNWQHKLAAGHHTYRVYGSYEAPASARRQRRIIERETRKAIAKTKQKGKR
jgi:hypothetical protein